jgi:CBS domain containing-hemolysin-like protein
VGTIFFVGLCGAIGATISTAVLTVVILIFGEITPKSIAKDCPEAFAKLAAPIIRLLILLFTPLNFLFSLWQKMIARLLHIHNDTKVSQEELIMMVEEAEEDGEINEEERTLIHNAIEFSELRADDILTPRVKLEGVSADADKTEFARVFSETKFSRLLVFEESIDKIVGVVHLKDFYTGSGITAKSIEEIMTPPVFAMSAERIDDLLRRLQQNKYSPKQKSKVYRTSYSP